MPFFDVIFTSNFDISCMGKWILHMNTSGAQAILYIKFDSEVKYTKYLTWCTLAQFLKYLKLYLSFHAGFASIYRATKQDGSHLKL